MPRLLADATQVQLLLGGGRRWGGGYLNDYLRPLLVPAGAAPIWNVVYHLIAANNKCRLYYACTN